MKICFLTSGHDPLDDRIFYHMAASLNASGHTIEIVSSKSDLTQLVDGINLNCFAGDNLKKSVKIEQFIKRLKASSPEVIICSEPLPVYAAFRFSKRQKDKIRIIYDITEWYPSKKNLCQYSHITKWFFFLKLLVFNIWVSGFADAFIFGEWYKSKPYRILFPGKPFIFTSYYPDLKYIKNSPPLLSEGRLRLSYSGKISNDKGFGNYTNAIKLLSERLPDLRIEVKIIGWFEKSCEKNNTGFKSLQTDNISVTKYDKQLFTDYVNLIKDTDIFIDLRVIDTENNNCLPIKLFYYAALGRPVIFSDLKAIRKTVDVSSFGYLIKPEKTEETVAILIEYINDHDKYYSHCNSARQISEERYNWKFLEKTFINFITCSWKPGSLNEFRKQK
jgi:glycosyltransferase involved in cell wall biosynthesis